MLDVALGHGNFSRMKHLPGRDLAQTSLSNNKAKSQSLTCALPTQVSRQIL